MRNTDNVFGGMQMFKNNFPLRQIGRQGIFQHHVEPVVGFGYPKVAFVDVTCSDFAFFPYRHRRAAQIFQQGTQQRQRAVDARCQLRTNVQIYDFITVKSVKAKRRLSLLPAKGKTCPPAATVGNKDRFGKKKILPGNGLQRLLHQQFFLTPVTFFIKMPQRASAAQAAIHYDFPQAPGVIGPTYSAIG